MEESIKNEDVEQIAKNLDGKTEEELKVMENKASEELQQQIFTDACTYVWNLMGLNGTYNPEAYTEYIKNMIAENKAKDIHPYSNWSDEEFYLNQSILLQGYGNFGKEFVDKILLQDPNSAKVLFETAMQSYLDLRYDYDALLNSLSAMAQAKTENKEEK